MIRRSVPALLAAFLLAGALAPELDVRAEGAKKGTDSDEAAADTGAKKGKAGSKKGTAAKKKATSSSDSDASAAAAGSSTAKVATGGAVAGGGSSPFSLPGIPTAGGTAATAAAANTIANAGATTGASTSGNASTAPFTANASTTTAGTNGTGTNGTGTNGAGGTNQNGASQNLLTLIDLTNQERRKQNLQELEVDDKLMKMARDHSANMAKENTMSHELDGVTFQQRLEKAGYQAALAGENIAAGQPTPAAAITAWMNSPGHRANILNPDFTQIGVGIAKSAAGVPYYTQDFGKPASSTDTPATDDGESTTTTTSKSTSNAATKQSTRSNRSNSTAGAGTSNSSDY